MLPPKYMKFNYDTYRPKKLIQDIWRDNNNYFYSKDVEVTPLTKIGDAAKVHQEQKAGKIAGSRAKAQAQPALHKNVAALALDHRPAPHYKD